MDKFEYTNLEDVLEGKTVNSGVVDLNLLYKQSNSELALQQSKRDQTISLYLAICTFFIPLVFSFDINWRYKGIMFLALGIIGAMFSFVIIRYRVYKEAYWLCSRTISQLMKYQSADLKKDLVQATFYSSIKKRGGSYIGKKKGKNGEKRYFKHGKYFKKNIFSAETLLYLILVFIVSLVSGLGIGLVVSPFSLIIGIAVGVGVGVLAFLFLLHQFFYQSEKVYSVLIDDENDSFNSVFSKAWFLHFYDDIDDKNKNNDNNETASESKAAENEDAKEIKLSSYVNNDDEDD